MYAKFYPDWLRIGSTRARNLFLSKNRERPSISLAVNYYFFTLGIKDPEGFGKKLEENCQSDNDIIVFIIKDKNVKVYHDA